MGKKKAKKKEGNKPQKINKELEARIKEEQQKLKQKKIESKAPKKQKKDKDISDKVEKIKVKKPKTEDIQKKLDYHRFLEAQMRKLDYAALFSYLGNLKANGYDYGGMEDERVKIAYKKDETISWERIKFYVDEHKMNKMMVQRRDFENNDERHAYKWWAAFNRGMSFMLFELSYT